MNSTFRHFPLLLLFLLLRPTQTTSATPRPSCHSNCNLWFYSSNNFIYQPQLSTSRPSCPYSRSTCDPPPSKWTIQNPATNRGTGWIGRQPCMFHKDNVFVKRKAMNLEARAEPNRNSDKYRGLFMQKPVDMDQTFQDLGYEVFTGGLIGSKKAVKYGYFEVRAKPAMLEMVSSFFLASDSSQGVWSEIDVYELAHVDQYRQRYGQDMRRRFNMNAHVFRDVSKGIQPDRNPVSSKIPPYWVDKPLAEQYRTYGLRWTPGDITWFLDGKEVARIPNKHWHTPLFIRFALELNYPWHGITPDPWKLKKSPKSYQIEWLRVWSFKPKQQRRRGRGSRKRKDEDEKYDYEEAEAETFDSKSLPQNEEYQAGLQRAPYGDEKMLQKIPPPKEHGTWENTFIASKKALDEDVEQKENEKDIRTSPLKVLVKIFESIYAPWVNES